MKYYLALFKTTKNAVEVEFPDVEGCVTFADNWDDAYLNAIDALAACLVHSEKKFIKKTSTYSELSKLKGTLVPIPVDTQIMESYEEMKRINVVIPMKTLKRIDNYRKNIGLKRSTLLVHAAEEYLKKHQKAV